MPATKETEKVNSEIAQFKLILDEDLIKKKYNKKFIFEKMNNINCRVVATDYLQLHHAKWIGNTILHFAIEKEDFEAFGVLISHGADITIRNNDGSTALHQFVDKNPYLISKACISEDSVIYEAVSSHIKYNNFENPVNANGLSHFHMACAVNNVDVVKGFLQHGVSLDYVLKIKTVSPIFPGFTPLHFAVKNCAFEVAEVLLSYGAEIHDKDVKGMTPVHVMLEMRLEALREVLINKSEKTLILFLEKESNDDMIVIDDLGLSDFHIVCTLKDSKVAGTYLQKVIDINHTVIEDSPLWPGWTALHFAAMCNIETVKLLMENGADISAKDAKGVTPFDICTKRYCAEDICAVISMNLMWKNIVLSDGQTKLTDLVFAMRDPNQFNVFFKTLAKDISISNSPLWPGYTPMHLAVIFSNDATGNNKEGVKMSEGILRNLLKQNPTMLNRKDINGCTPLHLAFRLNRKSTLYLLIECLESHLNLINHVDEDGLSYVHIASAENSISMLERLLAMNADINAVYEGQSLISPSVRSGSTALHLAVANGSVEAVEVLMNQDADIYAKDANDMTPIHLLLLNSDANILLSSPNLRDSIVSGIGLSHLHVACRFYKPEVVERLLDVGANPNGIVNCQPSANSSSSELSFIEKYNGYSPLLIAHEENCFKTVELLLSHVADIFIEKARGIVFLYNIFNLKHSIYFFSFLKLVKTNANVRARLKFETGMTSLHIACLDLRNFVKIEELLREGVNVNAQMRADSPFMKGYTPLHVVVYVSKNYDAHVLKRAMNLLLKSSADVMLKNGNLDTAVHMAWEIFGYGSATLSDAHLNMLLEAQRDFSVNPTNVGGVSHFHVACNVCNVRLIEKFLRHAVIDVNQQIDFFDKDYPGYSALHLAAGPVEKFCGISKQLRTIDLLLNHGANVHAEDEYRDTPLHESARFSSLDLFERVMRNGADLNARNVHGNTPLYYYLDSDNASVEGLKLLLRFGCHLNVFNAVKGEGYIGIATCKLPHADILNLVSVISVNFKQEMEADYLGRTICHNIVSMNSPKMFENQYVTLVGQMSEIDCDVDQQDYSGRTALHVAAEFHNYKGISGLLMAGADVNITDVEGKTAFVSYFDVCSRTEKCDCEINDCEHSCGRLLTKKVFAIHVKKLQFCGLDVTKDNEDLACEVFDKLENKTEWSVQFLKELETMKSITIKSHSLTLYDFLSENGAVADYPTMSQIKRDDVMEYFSRDEVDSFRQKFPEIAGILQLQYRKAIARPHLVEPAKNALELLIGFRMPEICSQIILVLLSNSDLKNLIASTI